MRKWEHRPVLVNGTYVEPLPMDQGGKQNFPHQEYPKMLYRAESADGGPRIADMITVQGPVEEAQQCGRGFSVTQEEAIKQLAAQQLEFAKLAANRAYLEKRMSPNAQAEAAALDETTMQHLPEIPAQPITRRGRKPAALKQE